jgi:protein-S-isoprenylcysteine O-methyltransferase Ste14
LAIAVAATTVLFTAPKETRGDYGAESHLSRWAGSMRPLPFTWPYFLVFWAVYVWAFFPEWKIVQGGIKGAQDATSKDSGSLRVLLGGMWVALILAFPLAFVAGLSFPRGAQVPLFATGLLFIVLGSLLRRYCFRSLGEFFTGDVRVREDQPVICTGPYRWVRHPAYTAGMMMFIGIGLALGSWVSFLLLAIASIATYGYRVVIEERILLQTLGEPYASYMKGRRRFIPHIV